MSRKLKSAAGNQDAKPALTPKLRFPEFRAAGGWESMKLGEICLRITNGKANAQDHEDNGIYPLFDRSAVIKRSSKFMFDAEAVILPGEGMRFVPKYYRGKFNLHQRAYVLMEHQGDARFVYYSLDYLQDALAKKAVKSTVLSLRLPIVENFLICCPKPAEQQKIAECLTTLDEVIAAQSQKLDALKTHKKGLMQQLFPREGETLPRLRFPEFQAASEWEEIELGQRMDIKGRIGYRGYTVEDIVGAEAGAISLSPSNINQSGVLSFNKATYISWAKYEESPEIIVEKGFTLLVKTGSTYGKAAFVKDLPWQCTINPQIVVLKPASIDPFFLYLLVAGNVIQTRIEATVVGGAIPTLSQESISKFKVRVPDLTEQQRIATCLTSLDDLITAQSAKLSALKTHKKGLMQQLFPSPEEIES